MYNPLDDLISDPLGLAGVAALGFALLYVGTRYDRLRDKGRKFIERRKQRKS